MADPFGLSFSPFDQNTTPRAPGQPASTLGGAPVQDAIRVLSLKLPQVVGPQAPIPSALLRAPGAPIGLTGTTQQPAFGGDLMEMIRRLLGIGGPLAPAGAPQGSVSAAVPGLQAPQAAPQGVGTAPVPRVIPGLGGPPSGPLQGTPTDAGGSTLSSALPASYGNPDVGVGRVAGAPPPSFLGRR